MSASAYSPRFSNEQPRSSAVPVSIPGAMHPAPFPARQIVAPSGVTYTPPSPFLSLLLMTTEPKETIGRLPAHDSDASDWALTI